MHPRDRLARATKNAQGDDVKFIKHVPAHPREMLRRKTKTSEHLRDRMRERIKNTQRKCFCSYAWKICF